MSLSDVPEVAKGPYSTLTRVGAAASGANRYGAARRVGMLPTQPTQPIAARYTVTRAHRRLAHAKPVRRFFSWWLGGRQGSFDSRKYKVGASCAWDVGKRAFVSVCVRVCVCSHACAVSRSTYAMKDNSRWTYLGPQKVQRYNSVPCRDLLRQTRRRRSAGRTRVQKSLYVRVRKGFCCNGLRAECCAALQASP
jgi:hypothetical protein